jgi:hypothetical protein
MASHGASCSNAVFYASPNDFFFTRLGRTEQILNGLSSHFSETAGDLQNRFKSPSLDLSRLQRKSTSNAFSVDWLSLANGCALLMGRCRTTCRDHSQVHGARSSGLDGVCCPPEQT